MGVPASPSGSCASHEAAISVASSPEASIPNAERLHPLLAAGQIPCRSCPRDLPFPATHIASAKRINDLPPVEWPVCAEHTQWAMVGGWFPIREVTGEDFASAIEARRAATPESDAAHESATRQGEAQ